MERQAPADSLNLRPMPLQPLSHRDRGAESNLPWPAASLIGRKQEIANACTLLCRDDVRLLTLTGPGGVGKTRLALAIAAEINSNIPDGTWFVGLAPVHDQELVASAIAHTLGIQEGSGESISDRLALVLRDQHVLLLLDNFEHVVTAAPVVSTLLSACPKLKVLVTSRVRLRVSGEYEHVVPPLATPDSEETLSVERAMQSDAVRLFVARAGAVQEEFDLTAENTPTIAAICRRLDGLPLAIELAAARLRVLPPSALLARLELRLPLLTGGARDAPVRLQSMRDAIAWSYELLTGEERALFRCLSVFVGGFSLDAAEAVVKALSGCTIDTFAGIAALVDASLLRQEAGPVGEPRYLMLETVREFGLEQLKAKSELEAVRDAHAAAFVALAEAARPHYENDGIIEWYDRVEAELGNCHAALEWADISGDAETVARLAGALWPLEHGRGSSRDSIRWLERALTLRDGVTPASLIEVLSGAALYYRFLPEYGSRANALASELLAHANALGDAYGAFHGHNFLGIQALSRSDYAGAIIHFRQCLDLAPTTRNAPNQLAIGFCSLASVAFHQGDLAAAASSYSDCLAHYQKGGNRFGIQYALVHLGWVRHAQGDFKEAASLFAESLAPSVDNRSNPGIAYALIGLAMAAVETGLVGEAARLLGVEDALRQRNGSIFEPEAMAGAAHAAAKARRAMGDEAFAAAWEAGYKMSRLDATTMAHAVAELVQSGSTPASGREASGLTSRELAVVRLLVEGLSDKEIAEALGITRPTATKHVETIRGKFGVSSRTAAAIYATRRGII